MTFHHFDLSPMVVCAKRSGTIACFSCNGVVIFVNRKKVNREPKSQSLAMTAAAAAAAPCSMMMRCTIVLYGTVIMALKLLNAMTFHHFNLSPMVVCAKRSGTIACSSCNRIVIFIRVRLQNQYCQVKNAMQLYYLFEISVDILTIIILAF